MSIPTPILAAMIIVGLIAGLVYVVGLTKKWGVLVPYAGMLLFGSMSLPLDWNDRVNPTFWLPIQQMRSSLFLGSGVAALIVVLVQSSRLRGKAQSISVWFFVMAGMYAALLRFAHDSPAQGVFSVVFSVCTLIPTAVIAAMIIDELDDFQILLRTVALVNAVWVGMVFVQILVNPKYVTMGNQFRFVGVLSNPQHAGVLMAFFFVITLWLLLNDRVKYKLLYMTLLGVNGLFLLWTGSRTGLGMAIIGVSAVLYTRAGRAILLFPFAALMTYIGLKIVVNVIGIDVGLDRLASTANTRDYAWWKLFTTGMENPVFGVGTLESEKSENSWLFGFAAFGVGMLGLMLLMTFSAVIESLKGIRARFSMPSEYRPSMDLVIGLIAMYFAGAVFEGYIVSRVSASLCLFPIIAGSGAILRRHAKQERAYSEHDLYPGYYPDSDNAEYDSYADDNSSAAYQ
jgi:hypothetical protein